MRFQRPACKLTWLTDTNYLAVMMLFKFFFLSTVTGKNLIFVKSDNIYPLSQNGNLFVEYIF